ncbi:MAG: hypothetical protein ACE5EU_16055 [Paracoccaceae bacterium]
MRRLAVLLILVAGLLAGTAARACSEPDGAITGWGPADPLTQTQRKLVFEALYLDGLDAAEAAAFWPGVRIASCDLDADRVPETVVFAETQMTCSLGIVVCAILVVGAPEGSPRVLLEASGHELLIADTRSAGWLDLIVRVNTRSLSVARFDGERYEFHE